MPFISAENVARVEMIYSYFGSNIENVYHVLNEGGWDESSLTALASTFQTWEDDEVSSLRSNDISLITIRAVDLTTETSPGIEVPVTPPIAGGNVVAGLPGNVTASIKMLTGLRGRSFRGRSYFVGLGENQVTGNSLVSATRDAIVDAYETLAASLIGDSLALVVLSLYSGVDEEGHPIPREAGVATPVTSFAMDLDTDSQRRRLTGRGS
jgi:hypothetical protein